MGNYKKERGVNPLNGYMVLFDTPRKERTRGIGAKTKPLQTKNGGPPRGDIWSEISLAFNFN